MEEAEEGMRAEKRGVRNVLISVQVIERKRNSRRVSNVKVRRIKGEVKREMLKDGVYRVKKGSRDGVEE